MIRLEKVSRVWPEFAIQDINLEVGEGEYLAIVGPTGAGKTLLLELLLGIHIPDSGRILVADIDVTEWKPEERGIGMVYQDYVLFPHLNVQENLEFGLRRRGLPRHERRIRVQESARVLGLEAHLHRLPRTLSGGEQQRVAIGRALLTEPRILLLDEPFSALDASTAERLREQVSRLHAEQGLTVLHVTHDLTEARQMGDRIALIHQGRIQGLGTAEELLRRPSTLFAARFVGAANLFQAAVHGEGQERCAVAGPFVAQDIDGNSERAHILVHPDEIAVTHEATSGHHNLLSARVSGISEGRHHLVVELRVPGLDEPLTAYLSRAAARDIQLGLGQEVSADCRHAIHVLFD